MAGSFALVIANFDCRQAERRKEAGDFGGEAAIIVKPVRTREQRLGRFEFGDARAKLGIFGNIRRVDQDEVEPLARSPRPSPRA